MIDEFMKCGLRDACRSLEEGVVAKQLGPKAKWLGSFEAADAMRSAVSAIRECLCFDSRLPREL